MSESIAEMILPGTYIEVRSEGLIAVGSIATGNIGIVGTAARGPLGEVRQIGSAVEAIDLFGPEDLISTPAGRRDRCSASSRTLKQVFAGRRQQRLRRAHRGRHAGAATLTVPASTAPTRTRVPADRPSRRGSWGNDIQVVVVDNGSGATPRLRSRSPTATSARCSRARTSASCARRSRARSSSTVGDPAPTPAAGDRARRPRSRASLAGGNSVPAVNSSHVADGLGLLEDQPVNIVLVAGLGASVAAAPLLAHVDRTENDGRERIARRRRQRERPPTR